MDDDFLLAIQLQEQFNAEYESSVFPSNSSGDNDFGHSSKKRRVEVAGGGGSSSDVVPYWKPTPQPERPLSIVDESWETLDPNPDVRAMFLEFNDTFFWGKLCGVEVKWSSRMTLCAGVCSYEGRGGLCSIRLSAPLLKLRPRKDLVQTLLHEMIHALLFVTQNNRDRDGHGPEFCKHMNRINEATGTSISVYHSFHDEVDVYRQHWWRCDGPCQNRKPYFGYVKRAMNRAPSSLDPWWEDHRRTCGGTYTKVKEPEGYGKKGKKNGKTDGKTSEKKPSGTGKPSSTTTGSGSQDIRNIIPFSGKGFSLGGKSSTSSSLFNKPPVPAGKTAPSSSISSPRKPLTPSSPAKGLNTPVGSSLNNPTTGVSSTFPSIRPVASGGQKPPIKRSVSNTRVFVSVNGSPVRLPKPHSTLSSSQGADRIKQKSIGGLFNITGLRKSTSQSSTSISTTDTKRDSLMSPKGTMGATSAPSFFPKQSSNHSSSTSSISKPNPNNSNHSKYPPVIPTKGSQAKPTQSKYFHDSTRDSKPGASSGGQVSRKRPLDDSGGSASILNFFHKTLSSDSDTSRESVKIEAPAMQQRTATATATSSTSSSSSVMMVSCPVCQAKVQESKINAHLDSCLS
ncbi:DNA-dependent metalloprotease SPRTN [Scomber scombrus]|uniref:DNA-dependent metalloprotease SPRTN n=1 Tax=Scomber scombrus TaxID=13677 RepID=UPI002DD9AD82|nr:DNA-dependent metalloprotease SPRTN [Scomber scombrus]